MSDERCGDCTYWHQNGGAPKEQRGPVILAAAAQGRQEPVQGQCRRELAVGFVVVPQQLSDGSVMPAVQTFSGYGPCPDTFPACGHFQAKVGVNGELAK